MNLNHRNIREARFLPGVVKYCYVFTIALVLLAFAAANAQAPDWEWAKGIGGNGSERPISIVADPFGNSYVLGTYIGTVDFDPGQGSTILSSSGGSQDIFLAKYDNAGNLVWAKGMGGPSYDGGFNLKGKGLAIDISGNLYCTGEFGGIADFDPDSSTFNLTSKGISDIFLAKYTNAGNLVWAAGIGGVSDDQGWTIAVGASNNIYVGGRFQGACDFDPGPITYYLNSNGDYDLFYAKYDNTGNFVWAKSIGSDETDVAADIVLDENENLFSTGSFIGTVDFDPNSGMYNLTSSNSSFESYVCKMDNLGNLIWAISIGGYADDTGLSIKLDKSGNIVTTGLYSTNGNSVADFDPGPGVFNLTDVGNANAYVLKLTPGGNFIWAKSFSGEEVVGLSIETDSLENIYSLGFFRGIVDFNPGAGQFILGSDPYGGMYLNKLDNSGNFVWTLASFNSGGYYTDGGSIALNELGNIYLTIPFFQPCNLGSFSLSNINNSKDFAIAKLSVTDPCANITCNINPGAFATNVSNAGCNNGTIKVKRGNGVYNFYPHIELYKDANLVTFIDLSPGTLEYTFTNLMPGKYTVKVSDGLCCQITFFRNIKCRAPSSGFQASNVAAQSVDLTWNVVNCAEGYRVQFRPVGTSFWFARNTNGNTGTISIAGLQPNTTYEWRVGTKCPGWPTTQSTIAYSPKSAFTTTALRVGEIITETNFTNEAVALNLFPNPATYTLTVNFEAEDEMANLKVVNTVGQVVYQKQLSATDGIYEAQLDVSNFSKGMYVLLVETANSISRKNFVKE